MMQMVRRFKRPDTIARAVLLPASEARVAAPTDSRVEADAYESTEADCWVVLGEAGAESYDAGDAFVAADVGEFDGCYGRTVGAGCCAGGGVEVWLLLVGGTLRSNWDSGCCEPL
jgi:hypothetical protein